MEKHGLLDPPPPSPQPNHNHATLGNNSNSDSCGNTNNNNNNASDSTCNEEKLLNKRRKSEERKLRAVMEKLECGKVHLLFCYIHFFFHFVLLKLRYSDHSNVGQGIYIVSFHSKPLYTHSFPLDKQNGSRTKLSRTPDKQYPGYNYIPLISP